MKKFIIIAIIGLLGISALFGSTEDVPEETEADTKTEQTSETTDEDKEEQKAEEEQKAKEKAKAEREQEEKKAEEERKAKEEQEAKQKAEEEQKAKQKAGEEAEAQAKAEEAADKANAEEIYLQIMRDSVGSYVDIQFDKTEKTYVMTPTDQGLIDEISMLPLGIGHEEWGTLVDGMTSMSKSGKDLVGEGYTINLVNPLNHENVILWIIDGEVIYNVIDDL